MAAKRQKAYFGLSFLVTLILHIFFGWILAPIVRIQREQWLGAILSFFGFFIFYWIDLVTIILKKDLTILA